ncbi:MAG TPA: hypothetical protein VF100_10225 [Thermoanaerobaculia bacterium]
MRMHPITSSFAAAALILCGLPAAAQPVVDFEDEPLEIEGTAENAQRMAHFLRLADNSIMDYINESTDSIQQGHRQGFSDFRDWYRAQRAAQAEREATERMLASIFGTALGSGLNLVFPGSGAFVTALKTYSVAAYNLAVQNLGRIPQGDINQFLDRHERVLEGYITGLENVPPTFRQDQPQILEAARWEFVFEAMDREARGEATTSDLGPSTRQLLQQAGVPPAGSATATDFRIRVLQQQIYGIYREDPNIRRSWGDTDMRNGAEASALRLVYPNEPGRYCPAETRLHDFFWSDACRRWRNR